MRKRKPTEGRPLFVELIGPAGAGKTTLATALSSVEGGVLVAPVPRLRGWRNLRFLVRNLFPLLPILRSLARGSGRPTWREAKRMIHLNGWQRILRQAELRSSSVVLLDHGPIYMLATLREFGPGVDVSDAFRRWWERKLDQWASFLDVVVWLDAANSVLEDRINGRVDQHVMKGRPQLEMHVFLSRYRSSFEEVMSMATARNAGLGVRRFQTDQHTTSRIADVLVGEIESRLAGEHAE